MTAPNRSIRSSSAIVNLVRNGMMLLAATIFGFVLTSTYARPAPAPPTLPTPIDGFTVGEGSTAIQFGQSSTAFQGSSVILQYQDSTGGTSTMTINGGIVSNWTVNLDSGAVLTFVDGLGGGQPGGFLLTSGNAALDTVSAINSRPFVENGNFLLPLQQNASVANSGFPVNAFVFNSNTYQIVSVGYDMDGMSVNTYSNGFNTCVAEYIPSTPGRLMIGFPDSTFALYAVDQHAGTYTLQSTSTVGNLLTQVNGYPLASSGNVAYLPSAPIQNFVWNGNVYTLGTFTWISSDTSPTGWALQWSYLGPNGSATATYSVDGSFLTMNLVDSSQDTATLQATTTLGTYFVASSQGTNVFSAFNGIPYVAIGSNLVPEGPVSTFTYGGDVYQFSSSSQASDGNMLASYQSTNGDNSTASIEWSPTTGTFVNLHVNPAGGGSATYVNGASVGQPGAYVWSTNSTAGNSLTQINSNAYTSNGNLAVASGAWTDSNGVFSIQGNFIDVGSWSNNSSHFGFSLSYYDGQNTTPSSVEFTASRPSTAWLWDATTSGGTAITPMMQLDQDSRLLLYAPDATTAAGAAGPTPSVILDPSTTNPSEFTGVIRFEGPVRIAPQGDLSMGTFTQDAFPAQPTL